jgi:hypothetical protein
VRSALFCLLLAGIVPGQVPRIGIIDFYGLRKVSETRLRRALGVKEGDALPGSKDNLEERLEKVPGVVRAQVTAVCCDGNKVILFVGIEEKGAPHFDYRSPPTGNVRLPPEIVETYRKLMEAVYDAARAGSTAEDLTHGYSLMANPECRALQEQFPPFAQKNVELLHQVLRNSDDAEQRAIAAYVIGYAPKKPGVVDDLLNAIQDPDDSVRNNAMRSLAAIAVLARLEPDAGLRIPPTWFIEMLNSIIWSDRNKAAFALVNLTEDRNPAVLAQLRERALPALVEMAQWNSLAHALPAFILLGRIAGLSEQQIHQAWEKGDRQQVILQLLQPPRRK